MRILLTAALCVLTSLTVARAGEDFREDPAFKTLMKHEAKVLRGLLKTALKEDYRRQAWYLADRILAADPGNNQAMTVMDQWSDDDLQQGEVPDKKFTKKRDKALQKLGDDWFHFGETLEAAGMDPIDYYPVNQRAHHYGSQAGNLLTALRQAGYLWLGTFLDREQEPVQDLLGPELISIAEFPPEFDDVYLRYRIRWPDAQVAALERWRLITDQPWSEGLQELAVIHATEAFAAQAFGKLQKPEFRTTLAVFKDIETYDKLGSTFVRERDRDDFTKSSSWYERWRRRCLLSAVHRELKTVSGDALIRGRMGYVLARTALVKGSGSGRSRIRGRGSWLFRGVQGAFEGIVAHEGGAMALDPTACWQLAVAAALREQGRLLPWETFFDLDSNALGTLDPVSVTFDFQGKEVTVERVHVWRAQATAVVVGIWKSKAGPKGIAKLVAELVKRDRLPDCDKVLKLGRDGTVKEANRAMDAALAGA